MKTPKFLKFKSNFYKNLLKIFGIGAVCFIFEACYGVPRDDFKTTMNFRGTVMSEDSLQTIPELEVKLTIDSLDEYTTQTSKIGNYELIDMPRYGSEYKITITDNDSNLNGGYFETLDTVLTNVYGDVVVSEFKLKRK
ncbi:MAG: hypothetical protein K9J13_05430 [Saprospiraceae bacterium]|nr:hypothetical protein [Saprospiraceae bacterium]